MFTGLIQDIGSVTGARRSGGNLELVIKTALATQVAVGDSIAINGVCLTATGIDNRSSEFSAQAVIETLSRTTLAALRRGDQVNLELALRANDRLGGHFVQGHVDAVGRCRSVANGTGSWIVEIEVPKELSPLVVNKGSVAVDGVSLTAYDVTSSSFRVSIIPHTWKETTLKRLKAGTVVNLEFDLLGKYVERLLSERAGSLTLDGMRKLGY